MDITLGLSTDCSKLEADPSGKHPVPQLHQTLLPNVLQRVLQAGKEVGDKLGDGAAIENLARNALGDQQSVAFGEVPGRARIARFRILRS